MTQTRDFPHVNLSLLTDREHLIITLHYGCGWSLRRVARGIGVYHRSVQRSHDRALHVLYDAMCSTRAIKVSATDAPSNGKRQ